MASNSSVFQTLVGSRSTVAARLGSISDVVEPAAHLQQFVDRDVVAIGHARDVLRDRIIETELAFLGQLPRSPRPSSDFVFEAIRKWGVGVGGLVVPSCVVP